MSTGFIHADVYAASEAVPIAGASVTVSKTVDGEITYSETKLTDESGKTGLFEVETPPRSLSLQRDANTMPYETYNMRVEAADYLPAVIEGIQVFEGEVSLQPVEMLPIPIGRAAPQADTQTDIPYHTLYRAAPNSGENVEGPLRDSRTLAQVVIPETIVVHLGAPGASATNVYVPFADYIKNVASSEIYPTWPEEAIRANILAQISFALNRVYTEWYRSRGYNFQITNSTAYDQAYVHGRNTYDNISQIVDEIFNQYLRRPGFTNPFFSSYCDGRQTQCDGLKQWGSFELANQGYSAQQILDYYYGPLDIVTAQEVEGIPQSFPGTPLRLGDSGEDVRRIQQWLNRIGQNYPAIGFVPATGVFDAATHAAVQTFQRIFNLTADGIVGSGTWYKIVQIYVSVTNLASLDAEAEGSESATGAYLGYIIREGQRGANVRNVQSILALLSTYYDEISPVDVDGIFGPNTTQAVKEFQTLMGLTPDGLVGRQTWDSLQAEFAGIEEGLQDAIEPYPGVLIREGSRGEYVRKMQVYLNEIAGAYQGIPTGVEDGIFGANTKRQVTAYQKEFGLTADGIIGLNTWNSIVGTYHNLRGETVEETEDAIPVFGPRQANIRKGLGANNPLVQPQFSQLNVPGQTPPVNFVPVQQEEFVETPIELSGALGRRYIANEPVPTQVTRYVPLPGSDYQPEPAPQLGAQQNRPQTAGQPARQQPQKNLQTQRPETPLGQPQQPPVQQRPPMAPRVPARKPQTPQNFRPKTPPTVPQNPPVRPQPVPPQQPPTIRDNRELYRYTPGHPQNCRCNQCRELQERGKRVRGHAVNCQCIHCKSLRRQQELALRRLFCMVKAGTADKAMWDSLAPMRNMILGLSPYGEPYEPDCD